MQFVAVDVGVDDSILEIATRALEHDMPFPLVKGLDGSYVADCGIDRTATAVVVDADFRIRYRGRIDNSFRLGGTAPGAASTELRDAIRDLLAGDEIKVSETPVDGCLITKPTQSAKTAEVSYTKQIAPILDRHCNTCHRPGTSAPFSLMSYDDVAANAAMIAEVVDLRRMPPWYASPHVGTFTNNRTLPAGERKLLIAWARAGAPHDQEVGSEPAATASREESPAAAKVTADPWAGKEWQFGEPDIVFEAPLTYDVPADGYIDYKYTLLPTVFLHDTYIQAAEIQPSNPRVVHHSNLGYMPIGTEGSRAVDHGLCAGGWADVARARSGVEDSGGVGFGAADPPDDDRQAGEDPASRRVSLSSHESRERVALFTAQQSGVRDPAVCSSLPGLANQDAQG